MGHRRVVNFNLAAISRDKLPRGEASQGMGGEGRSPVLSIHFADNRVSSRTIGYK